MSATNWIGAPARKARALIHIDDIQREYGPDITKYVDNSTIYDGKNLGVPRAKILTPGPITQFRLLKKDAVQALDGRYDGTVCVLNFASYKNPGGGFIRGAKAQEEDLCMASNLYNVLACFEDSYYAYNRAHLNRSLYEDRAIYTPNVDFMQHGLVDVLTCAAPNWNRAKDLGVTRSENNVTMINRINFVRDICDDQQVDVLIAGAWGCGVFGQDPELVCKVFRDRFTRSNVKQVIFAIPGGSNYETFKKVLNG